jgi:hypothetical protein
MPEKITWQHRKKKSALGTHLSRPRVFFSPVGTIADESR